MNPRGIYAGITDLLREFGSHSTESRVKRDVELQIALSGENRGLSPLGSAGQNKTANNFVRLESDLQFLNVPQTCACLTVMKCAFPIR